MSASDIYLAGGIVVAAVFAYCAFLIFVGLRLNKLGVIASVLAVVLVCVGFCAALGYAGLPASALFVSLAGGWLSYAFLRYRQIRQEELLQVIAAAVETNMPIGPAVRSYLSERPAEARSADWIAALFLLFPPGFLVWRHRLLFDHRAADLSYLVDEGMSLAEAFRTVGGLAPREVRVAASVGEMTGKLAECLRRADRDRLAGAWLEIVPRLVYPFIVLAFVTGVTAFLLTFIVPRFQKIYQEFGVPLPHATVQLIAASAELEPYQILIALAIPAALVWVAGLLSSSTIRWYMPLVGRLYQWEAQGLVLRLLGSLLEVGQTVPASLGLLADGDMPFVVRRCLRQAQAAVERGEPLADALHGAGLLPRSMVSLVAAAERARTLQWALAELGGHLAGRAVSTARRVSYVAGPVLIVAVSLVVAFVVLGMFMPLIDLLGRMS